MIAAFLIGGRLYCPDCVDRESALAQAERTVYRGPLTYSVPIPPITHGCRAFKVVTKVCAWCGSGLAPAPQEGSTLEHYHEGCCRYLPDTNEWVRR